MLFACFVLFFSHCLPLGSPIEYVTVQTSIGRVRGRVEQISDGTLLDIFTGIPYAEPPIGPLRFEKPVPLEEKPANVIDALSVPRECVPHHRRDSHEEFSEDCLYLNVFSPHRLGACRLENNQGTPLLPVLVFINMGGFQFGSMHHYGNFDEIGYKFVNKGIVVVPIQFRIGFFGAGFSSLGSTELPGNLAYWDMTLALHWIHQNVAKFGGDPERLTLFGYSSAASSIATLGLSPHSRNLFQQAFQMSGPIITVRAASDRVVWATWRLSAELDCNLGSPWKVKECMKAKSLEQYMEAMDRVGPTLADINYVLFGPVLDGNFIPVDFPALIQVAPPKRTIIGLTEMDPLGFATFQGNNSLRQLAIARDEIPSFGVDKFKSYLLQKAIRKEHFGDKTEQLAQEVVDFYTNNLAMMGSQFGRDDPWFYVERMVQFLSDVQFFVPIAREIRLKAAMGWPLFFYVSKYVNPKVFPSWFRIHKNFHAKDFLYIVRDKKYQYDADEDEKNEQLWSHFLVNFVQNGDPSFGDIKWPPISADGDGIWPQMDIDLPRPSVSTRDDSLPQRLHFWEQIATKYPQYDIILGRKGGRHGHSSHDAKDQI